MKSMRLCATLVLSTLTLTSLHLAAQGNPPAASAAPAVPAVSPAASGPMIQVANPKYDFGKAMSGEKVLHTYYFTNTGNATLHITNVQPSCHCTTVGNWTRVIEPGQGGEITAQLDTKGFGGGAPVQRTITVISDAKNEPRTVLQIKGTVWKPIDVTPSTAMLNIAPEANEPVTTTVRIVNQTESLVTFSNAVVASPLVTAALSEIKAGKEYELSVTAKPPFTTGTSWANVVVNTSSTNTPTITVPVMVRAQPAIQISPSQIAMNLLPDRWTTNRVNIHSTTTNVLSLSNPKASDSRIQVELLPMGPKGLYNLVVVFPPGFKLDPGQKAEVTVESNHPRFPVIKIPIVDFPKGKPVASWPAHANPPQPPVVAAPAAGNPPPVAQQHP
jgi:Protein of unknown function (DUF1573)